MFETHALGNLVGYGRTGELPQQVIGERKSGSRAFSCRDILIYRDESSCVGRLGEHLFNLGIGDRVSAFATEDSSVKIKIVP